MPFLCGPQNIKSEDFSWETKEEDHRPEHKLEDHFKMDLKAVGQEGMDLLIWYRLELSCVCCELNNKLLDFTQRGELCD